MRNILRISTLCLALALALSFVACSTEKEPAIAVCKTFIKTAATGDKKGLAEVIDFEAAAEKYGTPAQKVIKDTGKDIWEKVKEDMVETITATFSQVKDNYKSAFTDFKVEERGKDFTVVSYLNPVKQRKMMKVRNVNGSLKAYFYSK